MATATCSRAENVDTAHVDRSRRRAADAELGRARRDDEPRLVLVDAWIIPADYPLGDATVSVTFKTDNGKVGAFDYVITIIP